MVRNPALTKATLLDTAGYPVEEVQGTRAGNDFSAPASPEHDVSHPSVAGGPLHRWKGDTPGNGAGISKTRSHSAFPRLAPTRSTPSHRDRTRIEQCCGLLAEADEHFVIRVVLLRQEAYMSAAALETALAALECAAVCRHSHLAEFLALCAVMKVSLKGQMPIDGDGSQRMLAFLAETDPIDAQAMPVAEVIGQVERWVAGQSLPAVLAPAAGNDPADGRLVGDKALEVGRVATGTHPPVEQRLGCIATEGRQWLGRSVRAGSRHHERRGSTALGRLSEPRQHGRPRTSREGVGCRVRRAQGRPLGPRRP